jgi:hypothetical protein
MDSVFSRISFSSPVSMIAGIFGPSGDLAVDQDFTKFIEAVEHFPCIGTGGFHQSCDPCGIFLITPVDPYYVSVHVKPASLCVCDSTLPQEGSQMAHGFSVVGEKKRKMRRQEQKTFFNASI